MLSFGPPADRRARQEWWRRQIQRQSEGRLSVAEFCRRIGVSDVTFYNWKRRFREAAAVVVSDSDKPACPSNGASVPAFVPLSIPDAVPNGQLEIALANACVVRLTGAVDPGLLRIAIRAAGAQGSRGRGAE
jgi:transposase-like protein